GIGLWLIHTLVHEYGGHIRLTSAPGKGTRFGILLPEADAASLKPAARIRVSSIGADGEVLVVDDDVSVSKYLAEVLRDAGYNVRVFNDSSAALGYLEDNIDQLDVLVTDQIMPQISGLQLARRAKELRPALPVILITGYTHTSDLMQVQELGLEGCLKKPFRMDDLLWALAKVTGRKHDAGLQEREA
ncbi:MAG: response regulator, partial [Congregibacter sp.]|nr:response regulator [Congregibacter sp.]